MRVKTFFHLAYTTQPQELKPGKIESKLVLPPYLLGSMGPGLLTSEINNVLYHYMYIQYGWTTTSSSRKKVITIPLTFLSYLL